MLDSLSIIKDKMQKYLYQDLYALEETHWWHKAKRNLVSSFIKKYIGKNRVKILDVGCGTGKNVETFAKLGESWGLDSSREAILFCKKRGIKNLIKGSVENIPGKKEYFDFITALDVLEHVDDEKALIEIKRVMKKSGILIVNVPAFSILWSKWDEVLHHKRRYTKTQLNKVIAAAGFKTLKITYIYSFLFIPVLLIRTLKKLVFKDYYPSDFKLSNPLINNVMGILCSIERMIIFIDKTIPFGTSLLLVAQKK